MAASRLSHPGLPTIVQEWGETKAGKDGFRQPRMGRVTGAVCPFLGRAVGVQTLDVSRGVFQLQREFFALQLSSPLAHPPCTQELKVGPGLALVGRELKSDWRCSEDGRGLPRAGWDPQDSQFWGPGLWPLMN